MNPPEPPPSRAFMILAATIGNALEFYDFVIYGFFAPAIAVAFFPGGDLTTKLLLTFGTFGVSFLARPVGALALGLYADRRGRTASMVLSVSLMTLSAAVITLTPDRNAIGLAAPCAILAARLLRGFALGGEFGSATALMIEHSPADETRAASWQGISQYVASLIAAAVALVLTDGVAVPHLQPFRIAFGLGMVAGPIALLLRRRLREAPAFTERPPPDPTVHEPGTLFGIAMVAGMVAAGTAQTYLIVYLPTYAVTELHMKIGSALVSVVVLYPVILAFIPLRLRIARAFDRTRRISWMQLSCLALLLAGYPAFMLLEHWPGQIMLFLLPLGFTLIALSYNAPLVGFMGLVFPVRRRGIGLSVGYSFGVTLFGGFAPFINTWLIARTGDPRSPGLYLAFAALVSMLALYAARRRLGRRSWSSIRRHPPQDERPGGVLPAPSPNPAADASWSRASDSSRPSSASSPRRRWSGASPSSPAPPPGRPAGSRTRWQSRPGSA
jgi:MHS family proline/betaine transporter-like MFS transporter